MAGGGMVASGPAKRYAGRTTPYVVISCIVAASGGALFGYDNGVTGGVVAMPGFLEKFFPEVLQHVDDRGQAGTINPYCTYDNQGLQWFTSSLFIAGMIASIPAGYVCRRYGRKFTMLVAGILFDIGVVFITIAWHLSVLIMGRVLLGIAVAFASVAVTLYNSEMAPAHLRGRLNQIFQVVLSLGIVVAQAINLGTQHIDPWGWRVSLALAGLPAIVLTLGGIFLPDTPNSLIERGKETEGRRVLQDIRGVENVDEEFNDICAACKQANLVTNPWKNLLRPAYRPQLFISLTATLFQQWTGINTVIFYSPQLFITLGTGTQGALIATIVTGLVNHLATYVSLWAADAYGRRILWMEAGVQMVVSLVFVACSLAIFGAKAWVAWLILFFVCIYISAYAWSWGPLGWLYTSEVHPIETRSAGMSLTTLVNLMFSFVIGQTYLTMLCSLRWGIFLFFAGMVLIMTVVVYFFYPETKGLGIEDTPKVFKKHWFWKRYANAPDRTLDQELLATRNSSHENGAHENGSSSENPFTINPLMHEGRDGAAGPSGKAPTITILQRESPSEPATLMHREALSDDPFWDEADDLGVQAEILAPATSSSILREGGNGSSRPKGLPDHR